MFQARYCISRKEELPVEDIESEEELSKEELTDEETPEEPATLLVTNQLLPDITHQLDNLYLDMGDCDRRPTPALSAIRATTTGSNSSFKVNTLSEFSGCRDQVKMFKLQCLTYIQLNEDKLNTNRKQLLFLISYLRGPAYDWILLYLEDFLEHTEFNKLKATTQVIIAGKTAFFRELQTAFGYRSEKIEAERALQSIQQRGPVSKYKAEFQTLIVKTS